MTTNRMRLQKYLAACGAGSRRHGETLISAGRVTVNGAVVSALGATVDPAVDRVALDGELLAGPPAHTVVLALHKPRGYACTRSRAEGKTIYDLLPADIGPLQYAGRLDKNSEGLVLLSNDGDLVNRLTHPRYGHEKVYRVTVSGACPPAAMAPALEGLRRLDGERLQPVRVHYLKRGRKRGRTILEFRLREGRHHQVRRMCEAVRLEVHRLVRTAMAGITLAGLPPGACRALTAAELRPWRAAPPHAAGTDD